MSVSIHLERRLNPPLAMRIAVPAAAVVAGLVAGGVILALGGHDPIDAYNSMWEGSLGSSDGIQATLIKACPLVLTGLAVATALRIGLWNIGGEGQLIIGATAATGVGLYATSLPGPLVLPAMILAGCLAGATWATIAAIPRALIGLNEIIVTLFLNYIAILLMDHLIFGPWADPKAFGFAYSRSLPDAAVLPVIPGSYVHVGIVIAVLVAVTCWWLMERTPWGFSVRVAGGNARTAEYLGLPISRPTVIVLALSGAPAAYPGTGDRGSPVVTFWLNSVSVGIVLGTPLAYAALGELIAERAGVMNLGVEGMMLIGAVVGFIVTVRTQNAFLGMAAAVVAGAALASVHAVMTVGLRVSQIVMGLTLNIPGAGLSAYPGGGSAGRRPGGEINAIPIPVLSQLPVIGSVLFNHDVFVYAVPFIAIGIWLLIYRTRFGLWLRAAGEQPGAADASGVPVFLIRYLAVIVGGGFAGLAGAYFSVVYTRAWAEGMTGGRGWIAIALVIFGTWNPIVVLVGALIFGFVDGLNFQLQSVGVPVSSHLLAMMPYVFTP